MPALQIKSFNPQEAQDYFSQINSLAQRIATDIDTTKSTYGQVWHTLKPNEQNDVINETLMKPVISVKYLDRNSSSSSFSFSLPAFRLTSGEQILKSSKQNQDKINKEIISDSSADKSLRGIKLKQTHSSLSSPLAARIAHPPQVNVKIKPPSSPPPPPPVVSRLSTANSEANVKLESPNKLYTNNTKIENEIKTYYTYDGQNFNTYAAKESALKIVSNEGLRSYYDEHSRSFSYCTKSQIDLQQFYCNNEIFSKEVSLNSDFKQLQQEVQEIFKIQQEARNEGPSKVTIHTGFNHKFFFGKNCRSQNDKTDTKMQPIFALQKEKKSCSTKASQKFSSRNMNISENEQNNLFNKSNEKYISKAERQLDLLSSQQKLNYVDPDPVFEQGESATLMQNCGNSGNSASSNVSTNTSDDEQRNYEDDEKPLCEDFRLLDNDLNLRRGFDFLKNW